MSVTVAEYLFKRLAQLGVGAIHGVPGDYNLTLLDYVEPAGLRWVGNTNELNAGYAADGYARIKGLGALITTFGVGELSAINAIAGAYAERAAVVHIVGVPARVSQESGLLVHHTFNDGNFVRFAEIYRHVTVAQARLWDTRTCADLVDTVLQQCILHSRPVYIEIPVDVVDCLVSSEGLRCDIQLPHTQMSLSPDIILTTILERIYAAKQPTIIVDGETRAIGITAEVQALIKMTKWPTWTTGYAKSLVDEALPNFHGVYRGRFDSQKVQDFINNSDLILCFGPHYSSTNTFLFSSIPNAHTAVSFTDTKITVGGKIFRDAPVKQIIPHILQKLDVAKIWPYTEYPNLPKDSVVSFSDLPQNAEIDQTCLFRGLANFIQEGDIILGETGTAGYGVRYIPLPRYSKLFCPVTWLSIGYMLPACQGAALAQRELIETSNYHGIVSARTILLIGDGSFQMTVQELSTIIRHDLNVVVFLINNDGYTIERCIHGLTQGYNDVAPWRYLHAPHFFGAREGSFIKSVKTWAQLEEVLYDDRLMEGSGLRMVEIIMNREDAPPGPLAEYLEKQRNRAMFK